MDGSRFKVIDPGWRVPAPTFWRTSWTGSSRSQRGFAQNDAIERRLSLEGYQFRGLIPHHPRRPTQGPLQKYTQWTKCQWPWCNPPRSTVPVRGWEQDMKPSQPNKPASGARYQRVQTSAMSHVQDAETWAACIRKLKKTEGL